MRNNLIIQRALDIPAIRLEVEKQRKELNQAYKKRVIRKSNSENFEISVFFIKVIGTILGVVLGGTFGIIELGRASMGEAAYTKIRNEALTVIAYACAFIFAIIPSSLFVASHAWLRVSLWRKEPSLLQFVDFASIIDAIEAADKTTVTIPDEFICLISRNIITHPVCIIDCETNQKLPGVYEKSQLLLWLNESKPKIPRLNIPFDASKHRVEDDKEAAEEIQMVMEAQLKKHEITCINNIKYNV